MVFRNEFWIEKLNRLIKGFDYTNQKQIYRNKKNKEFIW